MKTKQNVKDIVDMENDMLVIECEHKHRFLCTGKELLDGYWCPICSNVPKDKLLWVVTLNAWAEGTCPTCEAESNGRKV
jgi:hypothetical protein